MSVSSSRLADELELFLDSAVESGRMGERTALCLEGLIDYTRTFGPVGCNLEVAVDFICDQHEVLERREVEAWLRSTVGMGVSGGVCH